MSEFSNYLEKEILRYTLGATILEVDHTTFMGSDGAPVAAVNATPYLALFGHYFIDGHNATSHAAATTAAGNDGDVSTDASTIEANWIGNNAYMRKAIVFGDVSVSNDVTSVSNNEPDGIAFAPFSQVALPDSETDSYDSGWGPFVVTHIAIFDQEIGGHMLYHTPLTVTKTLSDSDVLNFNNASITVTLD